MNLTLEIYNKDFKSTHKKVNNQLQILLKLMTK